MKKEPKRSKGIVKGTGRAVVLSILVHAGLFLIATSLIVFTVVRQKEVEFEPPQSVERPKMKLKKPKVRVKKSTRPKSTARIVSKSNKAVMPSIDLPEMSGMGGEGFGGEPGGLELMPDITSVSMFGSKVTTGSELEGYFYNFNRDRSGRKNLMDPAGLEDVLYAFMKGGWKSSRLSDYYRFPEPLYTPTICVPTVMSELAPAAFGLNEPEGYCWGVLYRGKLVYPEDITFRFWGVGDKLMAVQVDGRTVLICAFRRRTRDRFSSVWQTDHPKDNTYYFGEHRARPSDWITLKAGEEKDIQILMADLDGGLVYHMLSVEVEGQEYPYTRAGGGPTFPIFRTSVITRDLQDAIYSNLYPGDACLTNGPVFNDFALSSDPEPAAGDPAEPGIAGGRADEIPAPEMREWTRIDGGTFEAKFNVLMGRQVVFEDARRRELKVPLDQLSPEDGEYIEFMTPPEFDIEFSSKSKQIQNPPLSPWLSGTQRPLQIFDYTFGVRVKQADVGYYNREVTIEYFAVGEEVDGENYVLLDRRKSAFTPSRENRKAHEVYGDPVEIKRIAYRSSAPMRGTKFGEYLVIIRDERGKIIQKKASRDFLYDNLRNLMKLKPNNHFNEECIRVIPARPNEDSRGLGATRGN